MFSEDNVLAVAQFHPHTDLQKVRKTLKDNHFCLLEVKVLSHQKVLMSMEGMSDLVDLDLVHEYGAISVKLVGSELQEQELQCLAEGQSSMDLNSDFGEIIQEKEIHTEESLEEEELKPLNLTTKLTRVTSLEDLVQQEERMKEFFDICKSSNGANWTKRWNDDETKSCETLSSDIPTQLDVDSIQEKEGIWRPVVNGVALTALLVGGFKALSFFFNH